LTGEAGENGQPHYVGHRARLRQRFEESAGLGMADYEFLELVLFRALPRRDVKPIAKALIARFGSFAEVVAARRERLMEVEGVGDAVVHDLKVIEAAALRLTKGAVRQRKTLSSWKEVLAYCRTAMAFAEREEFRILFLDKRNALIQDEVQGVGTVDHTPVYPREVIRRALEVGATALVLVHNHPSGDPSPSTADVRLTQEIIAIAKPMGITVQDHLIIGRSGHTSLRAMNYM
jgi:DNA repair protein RadC